MSDRTTVTLTYRQDRPMGWTCREMAASIEALAHERGLLDVTVDYATSRVCKCGGGCI